MCKLYLVYHILATGWRLNHIVINISEFRTSERLSNPTFKSDFQIRLSNPTFKSDLESRLPPWTALDHPGPGNNPIFAESDSVDLKALIKFVTRLIWLFFKKQSFWGRNPFINNFILISYGPWIIVIFFSTSEPNFSVFISLGEKTSEHSKQQPIKPYSEQNVQRIILTVEKRKLYIYVIFYFYKIKKKFQKNGSFLFTGSVYQSWDDLGELRSICPFCWLGIDRSFVLSIVKDIWWPTWKNQ